MITCEAAHVDKAQKVSYSFLLCLVYVYCFTGGHDLLLQINCQKYVSYVLGSSGLQQVAPCIHCFLSSFISSSTLRATRIVTTKGFSKSFISMHNDLKHFPSFFSL